MALPPAHPQLFANVKYFVTADVPDEVRIADLAIVQLEKLMGFSCFLLTQMGDLIIGHSLFVLESFDDSMLLTSELPLIVLKLSCKFKVNSSTF